MTRILATALAFVLTTIVAYAIGHDRGAHRERQAQEAIHQRDRADALASAIDRATRAAHAMTRIGTQLRDAIAASRERERVVVKTITEVIRENPDFAAVRRPDQLARLRQAQLQAIADATTTDVPR